MWRDPQLLHMSSCNGLWRSPVNPKSYFLDVLPNEIKARAIRGPKLAFMIRKSGKDIIRNIGFRPPDAQTKAVEIFGTKG